MRLIWVCMLTILLMPTPGHSHELADGGGGRPRPADPARGLVPVSASELSGRAPIIPLIKKYFDKCVEKAQLGICKFGNLGIYPSHQHLLHNPHSCHNSGNAIDIEYLLCQPGGLVKSRDAKFFEVAKCMAHETNNELKVIYRQAEAPNMWPEPRNHSSHMHIESMKCGPSFGAGHRHVKRGKRLKKFDRQKRKVGQ